MWCPHTNELFPLYLTCPLYLLLYYRWQWETQFSVCFKNWWVLSSNLIWASIFFRIGRQRATQIPIVIMAIFTFVTGLSPNLYFYMVSQFIVGVSYGGFRVNCIVLGKESQGISTKEIIFDTRSRTLTLSTHNRPSRRLLKDTLCA